MGLSLVWLSTVLVRGGKPQILKCAVSILSIIGIFVRIATILFSHKMMENAEFGLNAMPCMASEPNSDSAISATVVTDKVG